MTLSPGAKPRVAIIGAGLGGLAAAVALAQRDFDVQIYEKNQHIGGKLNVLSEKGFSFDLGPSIFTLPQMFRPLFESPGKRFEDYVPLKRVGLQWRNFFEDGTVVDLHEDLDEMKTELARLGPECFAEYCAFLDYSKIQYDICDLGYFQQGLDTIWDFAKFYGMFGAAKFDLFKSMARSIERRIHNPYLRDIFEYFIKYVGSSAYDSPGFMNLMPHIQTHYGLWYVQGGLYGLALGYQKRLDELGVKTHLGVEVKKILTQKKTVCGLRIASPEGELDIKADYIVSNMEVIPAYEKLLGEDVSPYQKFEPACSGLVIHLGLDCIYPQLAHHNFFYSAAQREHFHRVFRQGKLPDDPTIYLVAPTRTDPTQAPPGCDNIKILPHIPHLGSKIPYTREDCVQLKERVLDKLERMGLTDLRKHIIVEDFWTPFDLQKKYYSNQGSIYGVVSNTKKNLALKAPKKSRKYRNLYFAGGSVNPGGGMPMVTLSGRHVARMIAENEAGLRGQR